MTPAPILWAVDSPETTDVRTHSGRVCRFRGWAVSTTGRDVRVRIQVAGAPPIELVPDRSRDEVAATLQRETATRYDTSIGWERLVRLPRFRGETLEATVEVTDGVTTTDPPARFVLQRDRDLRAIDTFVGDSPVLGEVAARHLAGHGVEFGALHQPLAVDPEWCQMQYADRFSRADALAIFADVAAEYADAVVEPDFLLDLDTSDLEELRGGHFDFFVANGVIEHLANPIRFLERVAGVMEPHAMLFLSAPDRDFTFDADRSLTTRRHLWREYRSGVTAVDDDHLEEAIRASSVGALPEDPSARRRVLDVHRQASVHVHVWDQASFDRFLDSTIHRLQLDLHIVERVPSDLADGNMVYVLRAGAAD